MSIRVFPVQGGAVIPNDFSFVDTANLRKHLGNDLFAPTGTPLLAVDNGTVQYGTDPLGGNVVNLISDPAPGGTGSTRYYYAHLSRFEGSNRRVRAGEIIGYIGTTGNAQGTRPHTHFEVHPAVGGASPWIAPAVNPFTELQSALARSRAPVSVASTFPWRIVAGIGLATATVWALLNYRAAPVLQRRRV